MRSHLSRMVYTVAVLLLGLGATAAQQNNPAAVKPVPPPGIAVPEPNRAELEAGIAALGKEIRYLAIVLPLEIDGGGETAL